MLSWTVILVLVLVLVLTLLFVSVCFRGEKRNLMNAVVLASQVTTRLNNA